MLSLQVRDRGVDMCNMDARIKNSIKNSAINYLILVHHCNIQIVFTQDSDLDNASEIGMAVNMSLGAQCVLI
jgi:hypothetical protein